MIRRIFWIAMLGRFARFQNLLLIAMSLSVLFVSKAHPQTVDEIFQNFKTAYKKSNNFSANFEETTLFANKKSVAHGRFIFGKPNLLRKEYVDRNDASKVVQLTVLDGEYGWTYTPILNQVNKMKWNTPGRRELVPGIGASLEDVQKNYDMALIPDEFANPKGVHQIELAPKAHMVSANAKETLQIWVQSGEWLPVQFGYKTEFEDGTRQSVIVTLKEIERDKELAPDLFKFVVPTDAEVIDLSEN